MIPPRFGSLEEFRAEYFAAVNDYCNFGKFGNSESIDIAVLDSVYDPVDDFKKYNRLGKTIDVLDANSDLSTTHGMDVTEIITQFAHDPTYHFIRFVNSSGKFRDRDLMWAIHHAREHDEIDIANISAGLPHVANEHKLCSSSGPECALRNVIEEAVEDGLIIVAAVGNDSEKGVHCPALHDKVISIGGMAPVCTGEIDADNPLIGPGSPVMPPNAYWIKRSDGCGTDQAFCTNQGCFPGEKCSENRKNVPSEEYSDWSNGNPNVLAPFLYPGGDEVGPRMSAGTSYATPIVTAGIINSLVGLKQVDETPLPREVRAAIERSAEEIDFDGPGLFSHKDFTEELAQSQGLVFEAERMGDKMDTYDVT